MGDYTLIWIIVLFALVRPVTVLLHELGHAIPAILFTKQKVVIYIGSYGDPNKSLHFNIGLLEVWFKYDPFTWRLGLCVPTAKEISINKQIIYILFGPITTFIIASITCYISFQVGVNDNLKFILLMFVFSSVLDLLNNLIPNENPIKLYDGTITHNDGYSLRFLFKIKTYSAEYNQATELFRKKKFEEASDILIGIINKGIIDEKVFRIAIFCLIEMQKISKAEELNNQFMKTNLMEARDFAQSAYIYIRLGMYEKALDLSNKSLSLNPNDAHVLNNTGYILTLLKKFEEAIPLLDKAIEIDKDFIFSYNNRGLSKIKTGKIEEGLTDINFAISKDPNNPYAYLYLGIYHLDRGEFDDALKLFEKAKSLDHSTIQVDEYLLKAKQRKN